MILVKKIIMIFLVLELLPKKKKIIVSRSVQFPRRLVRVNYY